MSENYPSDVKLNENSDGTVSFATEVVATIAGLAATEVDGVASMSSPAAGFADMFSRKNTRNFTKGVRIDLDGSKVSVDITIVVDYGSPVPDVARSIQENVKKAIETMSGLDVRNVDVHVTGISFEREQRANAELDEQQRKMLEKTEEAAQANERKPEAEADEGEAPAAEAVEVPETDESSEEAAEAFDAASAEAPEEPVELPEDEAEAADADEDYDVPEVIVDAEEELPEDETVAKQAKEAPEAE